MDFLIYLAVVLISFLGVFIGNYLIFNAPEELSPGRKYLKQTFFWFFSGIVFCFFFTYQKNIFLYVAIPVLVLILLYLFHDKLQSRFAYLDNLIYSSSGILLGLSSVSQESFLLVSGMTFLTGFPFGSFTIEKYRKKDRLKILKDTSYRNMFFVVLAIIFFFLARYL